MENNLRKKVDYNFIPDVCQFPLHFVEKSDQKSRIVVILYKDHIYSL